MGERARRVAWVAPADVVDVFVYVVVLGLAAEHVPSVMTESFTVSLLTAVLLKLVLELVVVVKGGARRRFSAATTPTGRLGSGLLLWLVLVGSKFLVLEVEDLVLGDRVELGGFVSVTLLILALLVARAGVRRLLGVGDPVVDARDEADTPA
ncbi:hypothetical protein GCM10027039_30720 [Terrabacter koreensis]